MPAFLTFALVAPIASFGAIAVGERRPGWDRPARSAILGLVGACLGLAREDDAAQVALATGYAVALLCHAPGRLLADYHTTQVPPTRRGRRFATRAAELAVAKEELSTILSRRDYRSGAWHLGAIWPRHDDARWPLPALAQAMRHPAFTPYLGRKSCPLGLPLGPEIATAADAADALLARHRDGPEASLPCANGQPLREVLADPTADTIIVLDADQVDSADGRRRRTEFRRDQPRSRRRWQFDLREEAVLSADPS
ncbi:MAG TPA: type I-E CRISPR-associated protein Cas5/CasD [Rhodopila sp.]|nr:type I-E CRISPR-associated protein Cas5/CasD [Rhodopila sp.]